MIVFREAVGVVIEKGKKVKTALVEGIEKGVEESGIGSGEHIVKIDRRKVKDYIEDKMLRKNGEQGTDGLAPVVSETSSGKANGITPKKSSSDHKSNSKQPKNSPQLSKDQIREIESMFTQQVELEYELIKINNGRDGLQYLWVQIVQAAVNGDISGFIFYSNTFQTKAEHQEKIWEEITEIKDKADGKYHAYASGNELVKVLTQPIFEEKTGDCSQMIQKGKELKKFRRVNGTELSVERLKAWGEEQASRDA